MHFFRRHKNLEIHLTLIALAVVMRSFIAPGYMLSISVDGGLGLAFCDGPVVMYQANDSHAHHNHDGNDGEAESHISTSCSFWSTSSVLVFNSVLEAEPVIVTRHQNQIAYQAPNLYVFIVNSRIIRGPPVYG
jgi:hypothetical protein